MTRLLLCLALAPSAIAQLQTSILTSDGSRPLGASSDLGSAAPLDPVDSLFEIRNSGSVAVSLDALEVSGSGFSILSRPSLGPIGGGMSVKFAVRFSAAGTGGYSAVLRVNAATYVLRASIFAAAVIKVDGKPLSPGALLDFGNAQRGTRMLKTVELSNDTAEGVTVRSITISGAFVTGGLPPLPLSLKPGTSARFDVLFAPTASRREEGTLAVDSRALRLSGDGIEPPLPSGRLEIPADLRSGLQAKAAIRLDTASEGFGGGSLQLEFTPAPGLADDPAILFIANSTRTLRFNIKEGDIAGPEVVFQTGTTAGTIVLTLELGEYKKSVAIPVAPSPVGIDTAKASRGSNTVTVRLAGFDNTRSAAETLFTFYDRNGTMIGAPIKADNSDGFRRYFQSSTAGGVFQLTAVFPVAGDTAQVDSVEIAMSNSSGPARSQRVRLE